MYVAMSGFEQKGIARPNARAHQLLAHLICRHACTTGGHAAWRRDVRYIVSAASAAPRAALKWMLVAEGWKGDIVDLPVEDDEVNSGYTGCRYAFLGRSIRARAHWPTHTGI